MSDAERLCAWPFPFNSRESSRVPVRPTRAATSADCIPAPLMHSVSKGQSLTPAHSLFKAISSVPGKKEHTFKCTLTTFIQNNT